MIENEPISTTLFDLESKMIYIIIYYDLSMEEGCLRYVTYTVHTLEKMTEAKIETADIIESIQFGCIEFCA